MLNKPVYKILIMDEFDGTYLILGLVLLKNEFENNVEKIKNAI